MPHAPTRPPEPHSPEVGAPPIPEREAAPDSSPLFRSTFERYLGHTDGKEKLAQAIGQIARASGAASLLDLGAGEGTLTGYLAPFFASILAVDKNPELEQALQRVGNTSVIIARMEELVVPRKVDMILMSYSLPGVPGARTGPFLRSLFEHCNPGGQILIATHEDGCPWDQYTDQVSSALGAERSGGARRHADEIRAAGLGAERVVSLDTFIWGSDLSDLFDTLDFFFLGHIEAYRASRAAFTAALAALAEPLPQGRVGLRVVESLYRLTR